MNDVIIKRLWIADISERAKAVQHAESIFLSQGIIISNVGDVIVALDISRLQKTQHPVRSRDIDRRARAELIDRLGRKRVAIARPKRRKNGLIWLKISQQARQRRAERAAYAWDRNTRSTAESERCLR